MEIPIITIPIPITKIAKPIIPAALTIPKIYRDLLYEKDVNTNNTHNTWRSPL